MQRLPVALRSAYLCFNVRRGSSVRLPPTDSATRPVTTAVHDFARSGAVYTPTVLQKWCQKCVKIVARRHVSPASGPPSASRNRNPSHYDRGPQLCPLRRRLQLQCSKSDVKNASESWPAAMSVPPSVFRPLLPALRGRSPFPVRRPPLCHVALTARRPPARLVLRHVRRACRPPRPSADISAGRRVSSARS